jgi:hypothetical protein
VNTLHQGDDDDDDDDDDDNTEVEKTAMFTYAGKYSRTVL